jgi:hypothetical protein
MNTMLFGLDAPSFQKPSPNHGLDRSQCLISLSQGVPNRIFFLLLRRIAMKAILCLSGILGEKKFIGLRPISKSQTFYLKYLVACIARAEVGLQWLDSNIDLFSSRFKVDPTAASLVPRAIMRKRRDQ